ncbi:MAG: hypothetical protein ACI89Z_000488 [Porticoccus sp.]|jgi:hypothetical protein
MNATMKMPENLINLGVFIRCGAASLDEAGLFFGLGTDNYWDESLALVLSSL